LPKLKPPIQPRNGPENIENFVASKGVAFVPGGAFRQLESMPLTPKTLNFAEFTEL
jgi:hypothetical protein